MADLGRKLTAMGKNTKSDFLGMVEMASVVSCCRDAYKEVTVPYPR